MQSNKYGNNKAKTKKWIKEGRGAGHGHEYLPWLTVRDLASRGRSHRIFGHKSQRTHHLLSDLELATFFLLEWHSITVDIREQFPLRIEDTMTIAKSVGIKHPSYGGVNQVMSSDFLINTTDSNQIKFSLQAKYSKDLQQSRTIEKLEIERRYWKKKSIPWQIVTEKEIPLVVFQNIKWLYPAQRDELDTQLLAERAEFYQHQLLKYPKRTIIEIAKKIDTAYNLHIGESLLELRQLLAKRYFKFDIFVPYKILSSTQLAISNDVMIMESLSVSN